MRRSAVLDDIAAGSERRCIRTGPNHFYSSRLEREIRFTPNYSFSRVRKVRTCAEISPNRESVSAFLPSNKRESCLTFSWSGSKCGKAHKLLEREFMISISRTVLLTTEVYFEELTEY